MMWAEDRKLHSQLEWPKHVAIIYSYYMHGEINLSIIICI